MINEEKFMKVKRVMAARKAMHYVKELYWNPKNVLPWCYWVILIVIGGFLIRDNDLRIIIGIAVGVIIGNVMEIFFATSERFTS